MKNSVQGFGSRSEDSEGRISKLEDRIVKGTQTEEEKKEKKEKWTEPKGPLGLLSGPTYALWESQKEEKERGRERRFIYLGNVVQQHSRESLDHSPPKGHINSGFYNDKALAYQ